MNWITEHDMSAESIQLAEKIAAKAAERGGRAYYVGGFVRDRILGRETKDIDIEVHALTCAELSEILSLFGECTSMGASFGIFSMKGYDLDIAIPRKEKNTGRGHKDFEIYTDPYIGPEKAAMRRDFTVNAMMQDVLTGEVLDFYGGRRDLENRILRHVNRESFAEDPLRVLRGAQFAARFGFTAAEETIELCRSIDLRALPKERVTSELKKALLQAECPSVFFEVLQEMGQLDIWFPEVKALCGIEQNPEFHPEGDVWTHTMLVLDGAASLLPEAENRFALMLSALCHDFGKITTTAVINGKIHAYQHETEGLPLVRKFLRRLTNENAVEKYVLNMTELHMRPNMLVDQNSAVKAFMKLFDASVSPKDLLLLSKADFLSALPPDRYIQTEKTLREYLKQYRELMQQPQVQGADLIEAGITPGPEFKEALAYAHKLHLAGIGKENALKQTIGYLNAQRKSQN